MQNFFSSLLNILFPSKQNTKIVNYYQFSSLLEFFNSLLNKLFPSRQNQNNDKFPSNMLKYFKSWLNKQNPEIENDITAETAVKVVIIVLVIICLSKFIKFLLRRLKWRRNGPNIIHTANECHNAVLELRKKCKDVRVIGLDCEWVFEGRIALLQLASIDGYCSLIRLCALGYVPSSLEALLSDRSIIKTGVAVNSDASRLLRDYGVRCNGVLDLRHMAQAVGSVPAGLGKMSNLYLNKELDKDRSIACSNWEAGCLSERQIQYAADDALVSVQLFQYFNNLMLKRDLSWYKRLFWSYKNVWARVEWYWRSYIDLPFPGDQIFEEFHSHSFSRINNQEIYWP